MFFGAGYDLPGRPGTFTEHYRCFSAAFIPGRERDNINYGSKIILPPSALAKLTSLHIEYPMLFQLTNEAASKSTHGGVLEFIAEEGRVYVPRWMMVALGLQEGELVKITSKSLPQGKFVKIQPQSVDFLDIFDPKAVLERAFRSYSTLTQGDIISLSYNDKQYDIFLMEVKPAQAVSIIETDLEVDFAPPVGYVEPQRPTPSSSGMGAHASIREEVLKHVPRRNHDEWVSRGSGNRLGGARTSGEPSANIEAVNKAVEASSKENTPLPLRLPLGQLFFGFDVEGPPGKGGDDGAEPDKFQGKGNTLRGSKGKGKMRK